MAFRYAVERINMHEKRFEFVPLLHHVSDGDSFKAERIGN
jgi:glutamate receptor, ionotropic, invertebrate